MHQRRYDLDWLRFIAFSLLIFYHVGMFYVTWGWHVKSQYASPLAEPLMLAINPWRLALLFFISGVAVRFAMDRSESRLRFAGSRIVRLGAPVLLGVYLLVMPQSYFELRQAGVLEPGILDFYPRYLSLDQQFPIITPTWNHLWYLVYLLVYILLCVPMIGALRSLADSRVFSTIVASRWRLIIIVIVPFVAYELLLTPRFPTTHALFGDWANHAHRLTVFVLGYLVAKHPAFWRTVDRTLPIAAVLATLLLLVRLNEGQLWTALTAHLPDPLVLLILIAAGILYAWTFILVLLGLAQRHLNSPSQALRYLTSAVFCYYVVHQTIIIAAGYHLTRLNLGAVPEFISVAAITVLGCAASYAVLRRIPVVRVFFGIRAPRDRASGSSTV